MLWAQVCGCVDPVRPHWRACHAGRCGPWGWREVAPRGATCHRCEGRPVSGALPPPADCPWGGQPRPVTRASRARVLWVWGPSTSPTASCVLWGWREGVPWGGVPRRCEGRLRLRARPPPAARVWGGWREVSRGGGPLTVVRGIWRQALSLARLPVLEAGSQAPLPVFLWRGWCWRGDRAPAQQRALFRAGVAGCGGGGRASLGGGCLAPS